MDQVELDQPLRDWVKHCHHYSDGFMKPQEINDREKLSETLAYIIWNCSVVHSADHWELLNIPLEHRPMRLRIPPPFKKQGNTLNVSSLMKGTDRIRQVMTNKLYNEHWIITRLVDIDYGFDSDRLKELSQKFVASLKSYATTNQTKHIPLDKIMASIQH